MSIRALLGVVAAVSLVLGCHRPLVRVPLPTPAFPSETLVRMQAAVLEKPEDVLAARGLQADPASSWRTDNPYQPVTPLSAAECQQSESCRYALALHPGQPAAFPAEPVVYQWWTARQTDPDSAQVCGLRFTDEQRSHYRLQTFSSLGALQDAPGWHLTHFQPCGTCSTLQDLAVYATLDLTVLGRACSKRLTLAARKACMQEIGFSEACAETWAYNAQNTAAVCAATCLRTFGLLNVLRGTEQVPPTDAHGTLNACLQCDETQSGPGFQFAAGRTRRSSGIVSEISRGAGQIYRVPHDYFR